MHESLLSLDCSLPPRIILVEGGPVCAVYRIICFRQRPEARSWVPGLHIVDTEMFCEFHQQHPEQSYQGARGGLCGVGLPQPAP